MNQSPLVRSLQVVSEDLRQRREAATDRAERAQASDDRQKIERMIRRWSQDDSQRAYQERLADSRARARK